MDPDHHSPQLLMHTELLLVESHTELRENEPQAADILHDLQPFDCDKVIPPENQSVSCDNKQLKFHKGVQTTSDVIVSVCPKDLTADNPLSIMGHYVSPNNVISSPPLTCLAPFVSVVGNQYRQFFFIAIRLKNPIIVHKQFGCNHLKIPSETCLLTNASADTLQLSVSESLFLFTYRYQYARQKSPTETDLLETFFPPDCFITKAYGFRTLYAITTYNPFQAIWTQTRKNISFHSLVKLFNSCINHTEPFTIHVAATLRTFKRNLNKMHTFASWYSLAHSMARNKMIYTFHNEPTTCYGKKLYDILKRTDRHTMPKNKPPEDFYQCQLTLSDTVPVGVACRIVDGKTEYVSVMILSFTLNPFHDVNHMSCCFDRNSLNPVMCRHWLPLFKNKENWKSFGLEWYTRKLRENCTNLISVIDWLSIQTAEPYRHMKTDLIQVYSILTGMVKQRWF